MDLATTREIKLHGRHMILPKDHIADMERVRDWAIGAGWWRTAGGIDQLISEERIRRAREGRR